MQYCTVQHSMVTLPLSHWICQAYRSRHDWVTYTFLIEWASMIWVTYPMLIESAQSGSQHDWVTYPFLTESARPSYKGDWVTYPFLLNLRQVWAPAWFGYLPLSHWICQHDWLPTPFSHWICKHDCLPTPFSLNLQNDLLPSPFSLNLPACFGYLSRSHLICKNDWVTYPFLIESASMIVPAWLSTYPVLIESTRPGSQHDWPNDGLNSA
jgi:hypothetical protein